MKEYAERDFVLYRLGFHDYHEYLQSDLWAGIRGRAFRQNGNRCLVCDRRAHLMHHRHYRIEVLLGYDLTALVPLCDGHHESIEFTLNGRKRTLNQTDAALRRLLNPRKKKRKRKTV